MPGDDDTTILCFGVGDVNCKNTIALPHYEHAIITGALKWKPELLPGEREKIAKRIKKKMREIQNIMADATGGTPYEFTGDPNALPECGP